LWGVEGEIFLSVPSMANSPLVTGKRLLGAVVYAGRGREVIVARFSPVDRGGLHEFLSFDAPVRSRVSTAFTTREELSTHATMAVLAFLVGGARLMLAHRVVVYVDSYQYRYGGRYEEFRHEVKGSGPIVPD
jgi:hypothetical protein